MSLAEDRAHILRALREARFASGLFCPRCGARPLQRWGQRAGRQRYRCRACRRTCNDLTGTVFAYGKRPELWIPYGQCLLDGLTVRAAAARLGIHKDTAWRWRHQVLAGRLAARPPVCQGITEVLARPYPDCHTGERHLPRPARHHGAFAPGYRRARIWVLFARDRTGTVLARPGGTTPAPRPVLEALFPAPAGPLALLLGPSGPCSALAGFARAHGIAYRQIATGAHAPSDDALWHLRNLQALEARFRHWLQRFRGVATKYLARYLHWFLVLEARAQAQIRLLLGTVPPPPAGTEAAQAQPTRPTRWQRRARSGQRRP